MKAHGLGVHTPEEIEQFGKKDLQALSEMLGDKVRGRRGIMGWGGEKLTRKYRSRIFPSLGFLKDL